MLPSQYKEYLEQNRVRFEEIPHSPTFTASQTAQAAHIPGRHVAKVVMVKVDGDLAMAVIPANGRLDIATLKHIADAENIEIAHEYEFNDKFPNCEVGAMPPFGDLFNMDVYLADSLSHEDWLAFNCGTHSELVKVSKDDFLKLIHPEILPRC